MDKKQRLRRSFGSRSDFSSTTLYAGKSRMLLYISPMVKCFAQQERIGEELKTRDPMEWVRRMNGIKAQVEEFVLSELVYE